MTTRCATTAFIVTIMPAAIFLSLVILSWASLVAPSPSVRGKISVSGSRRSLSRSIHFHRRTYYCLSPNFSVPYKEAITISRYLRDINPLMTIHWYPVKLVIIRKHGHNPLFPSETKHSHVLSSCILPNGCRAGDMGGRFGNLHSGT